MQQTSLCPFLFALLNKITKNKWIVPSVLWCRFYQSSEENVKLCLSHLIFFRKWFAMDAMTWLLIINCIFTKKKIMSDKSQSGISKVVKKQKFFFVLRIKFLEIKDRNQNFWHSFALFSLHRICFKKRSREKKYKQEFEIKLLVENCLEFKLNIC